MTIAVDLGRKATKQPTNSSPVFIQSLLKAPITTAEGDKFCDIFFNFSMIFHEDRLPGEDSHEISKNSCLICYLRKSRKI